MSRETVLVPGTGIAPVVVDEVLDDALAAANVEVVKLGIGAAGVEPELVDDSRPLPTRDGDLRDAIAELTARFDAITESLLRGHIQVRMKAGEAYGANVRVQPVDAVSPPVTMTRANTGPVIAVNGYKGVGFTLTAGLTGTLTPQASLNGGRTWIATYFDDPATGGTKAATLAPAGAAVSRALVPVTGATHYRVTVTTFTSVAAGSGPVGQLVATSSLGGTTAASNIGPTGIAVPPSAALVGCSDGTLTRNVLGDTSGRQIVVGAGASTGALTGNPVAIAGAIVDGAAISTHRGTMIGTKGSDGAYHHVVSDAFGNVKTIMSPTASSVHSSSVVTSSSNSGAIPAFGARCMSLYYTVSSATNGGGTMTYTVEELAADATTVIRSSSKSFSATGSGVVHLGSVNSYYVRVSWTLTGSSPSYTVTSSLYASSNVGSMNEGAPGDAIPGQTALVGGTDLGTLRALAVSPSGGVRAAEGGIATYAACFTDTTGTGTSGGATALTLWHTSANATPVHIRRITISCTSGTVPNGNSVAWKVRHITAENGTPGGTTITASPVDRGDAASTLTGANGTIRSLPAAPTAASGSALAEWSLGIDPATFVWEATAHGKPIELRASNAEGLEIRYDIAGTLTLGILYTVTVEWTEGTAVT